MNCCDLDKAYHDLNLSWWHFSLRTVIFLCPVNFHVHSSFLDSDIMHGNQTAMMQLLDQCLARIPFYHNVPRIRQDMSALFYNCPTLRPNVGSFQASTGMITLFYLSGVVPITYGGANYNIPITMYFDPPYPNQPPRVFVTPTNDMVIKQNHRSVDVNGRVYLPVLTSWNAYNSSLVTVVANLSQVFSQEPPVHAVRKGSIPSPKSQPPVVVATNRRDDLVKSLTVKLRAKLPTRLKTEVDSLNAVRSQETSVRDNATKIKRIQTDLSILKEKLDAELILLDDMDTQNREWVKKNSTPDVSPDTDAVGALAYLEAESAVGQQVIDLLAEECAHEDLIDYFSALNREGKLSMSELLREMRQLTRKVFELRTLKRKALVVLQSATARSLSNPLSVR